MPRIRILFEKEKQRIMGRKRYINEIEANAMAGTQFKKKKAITSNVSTSIKWHSTIIF